MSDSDDNIPELNEMIFPGRPEKIPNKQPTTDSADNSTRADKVAETSPQSEAKQPKPKQTNFETLINQQIDAILERHIHAAREEIVRVVMLELRSRLPNAGRRNP